MSRRADLPNIVLIVFDTARADAFGPYGAGGGTTPVVAQLASRGTAFPRAIAPCNWTMPSHASMLTGLLPRTAGLSVLPGGQQANCRPVMESHQSRLLPEVLRRAGYRTAGASTNLWISTRLGFATGFDEFHDLVGKRVARMHDSRLRSRVVWYAQALLARVDDGLAAVEVLTKRWLQRRYDAPFFWFFNVVECHSPYLPPKPYNDLGPLRRLRAAEDARRHQTLSGVWRCCATGVPPPEGALERMRYLYARSIRMMDDWLGRFLDQLDAHGLIDQTLVVVTSDHGENFGEGNLIGHAVSLDDRLVRVPFVCAGPGTPTPSEGAWSLAELPRLIANSVGLEDHPWLPDDLPHGPAVAQYDVGADPEDPRWDTFHEWGATEEGLRRFREPGTCATDGRFKLVVLGDTERLYDLEADPMEVSGLTPGDARVRPDRLSSLRRAIAQSRETEWAPDLDALKRRAGAVPAASEEEIKDLEDRMRLLGYL